MRSDGAIKRQYRERVGAGRPRRRRQRENVAEYPTGCIFASLFCVGHAPWCIASIASIVVVFCKLWIMSRFCNVCPQGGSTVLLLLCPEYIYMYKYIVYWYILCIYIDSFVFHPFSTAVPFWVQITSYLKGLSPKRDCISKRVNMT